MTKKEAALKIVEYGGCAHIDVLCRDCPALAEAPCEVGQAADVVKWMQEWLAKNES